MKHINNFLKGIVIGIAMLIPGVSGGTMAIVMGIYDKLIHSASNFFKDIKNNIIFLGIVFLGGAAGILAFSNIIDYGLKNLPFVTIFLFLGIIVGGFPILVKQSNVKKIKRLDIVWIILGFVIVLGMSFVKDTVVNIASEQGIINMLFMVLAGFIASIAFILPGISGSFFLLIIGLYDFTISAIKDFNFMYIIPFGFGALLGVILTVKIIEKLLNNHRQPLYLVIFGFIIGSVVSLFIDNIPYDIHILYSILAFIAGAAITLAVNMLEIKTAN